MRPEKLFIFYRVEIIIFMIIPRLFLFFVEICTILSGQ